MSLASWKKEFYPKSANQTKRGIDAISHSLKKWSGLTKANLRKHKVIIRNGAVVDPSKDFSDLYIDADTCSLCRVYYSHSWQPDKDSCAACPLYIALGGKSCDDSGQPYRVWSNDFGSPMPMIRALKKTLKLWKDK